MGRPKLFTKAELRARSTASAHRYYLKNRERINAYQKEYRRRSRLTPEGRAANAAACRKANTGFTQADWDARFIEQTGLCAVCRSAAATCADHNHLTKQKRGLLCHRCNLILGHIEGPLYSGLIAYLGKWNGRDNV